MIESIPCLIGFYLAKSQINTKTSYKLKIRSIITLDGDLNLAPKRTFCRQRMVCDYSV